MWQSWVSKLCVSVSVWTSCVWASCMMTSCVWSCVWTSGQVVCTKLCVDKLCVDKLCVDKLYVTSCVWTSCVWAMLATQSDARCVCGQVVWGQVVWEQVVWEQVVCGQVVCEQVVCGRRAGGRCGEKNDQRNWGRNLHLIELQFAVRKTKTFGQNINEWGIVALTPPKHSLIWGVTNSPNMNRLYNKFESRCTFCNSVFYHCELSLRVIVGANSDVNCRVQKLKPTLKKTMFLVPVCPLI